VWSVCVVRHIVFESDGLADMKALDVCNMHLQLDSKANPFKGYTTTFQAA